jgi:nicotinate-nucleotide--dimethylbenzimidazole phosphoribosyltransferase
VPVNVAADAVPTDAAEGEAVPTDAVPVEAAATAPAAMAIAGTPESAAASESPGTVPDEDAAPARDVGSGTAVPADAPGAATEAVAAAG